MVRRKLLRRRFEFVKKFRYRITTHAAFLPLMIRRKKDVFRTDKRIFTFFFLRQRRRNPMCWVAKLMAFLKNEFFVIFQRI